MHSILDESLPILQALLDYFHYNQTHFHPLQQQQQNKNSDDRKRIQNMGLLKHQDFALPTS